MKIKLINLGVSILFFISIVLTIISLTVLNDRFIMKVMDKKGYINLLTRNINEDLKKEHIAKEYSSSEVRGFIKDYVKGRYVYDEKTYETEKISNIVNKHILFMGKKDYKKGSYIIYLITIISIIITGNVFLKSKKIHDLADIFIYTFVLLVICYGVIYFNLANLRPIVRGVIDILNHIILGGGVILLELGIIKKQRLKKLI